MQSTSEQAQVLKSLEQMVVKDEVSLGGLPPQQLELALGMAAKAIAPDQVFNERQINERLRDFLSGAGLFMRVDHVELRRWLADFQWLHRDDYGREYRRTAAAQLSAERAQVASLLATLDVPTWVQSRRAAKAQLRQARLQQWQQCQAGLVQTAEGTHGP